MHFRGVICLDCHHAHSARTILPGNWLCMRLSQWQLYHAPVIAPVAHSHHKVFGYSRREVVTNFDLMEYKPTEIKKPEVNA